MSKSFMVFLLLGIFTLAGGATLQAQKAYIKDVKEKEFKGVFSIKDRGYYTFYIDEKAKKGQRNFIIEVYDFDLNLIKRTPTLMPKGTQLIEGTFNGTHIIASFIDLRKRVITYQSFDNEGNKVAKRIIDDLKPHTFTDPQFYPTTFAASDGFYIVEPIKEKKYGYNVKRVDDKLKKVWTKKYMPTKGFALAQFAESGNNRLVLGQMRKEKILSKKFTNQLLVFDDNSGDILYKYNLNTPAHVSLPSAVTVEENGDVTFGGMYFEGEKAKAGNSDGVFFTKLDSDGKEVFSNYNTWDGKLQAALEDNTKRGFLGTKPKVMFHKIMDNKGDYLLIGEIFNKSASALGIAGAVLSGGRQDPGADFNINDFITFTCDGENGEISKILTCEKKKSTFWVPTTFSSGMALAHYAKKYELFAYRFVQKNEMDKNEIVFYVNEDSRPYIGVGVVEKDNIEVNELPIDNKAANRGRAGVVQSDGNRVLVFEYNKKDRIVTMELRKY